MIDLKLFYSKHQTSSMTGELVLYCFPQGGLHFREMYGSQFSSTFYCKQSATNTYNQQYIFFKGKKYSLSIWLYVCELQEYMKLI